MTDRDQPETPPPPTRPMQDGHGLLLWGGALLVLFLGILRILALRQPLAVAEVGALPGIVLRGVWQDWLVVLVLTLVALAARQSLTRPAARRIVSGIFVLLATAILVLGMTNLVALRMLGAPVTLDWVVYSDIANTDVILDSLRRLLTPQAMIAAAVAVTSLWGLSLTFARRLHGSGWPGLTLGGAGFAVIAGLALAGTPIGVAKARFANPAVAFVGSLYADGGTGGLQELAKPHPARQIPFPTTQGVQRPPQPAKPLRNVIVFAYESTPAKQAQGWGADLPVTPHLKASLTQGLAFDRAYAHVPASNYFLVSMYAGIIPELSATSMTSSRPTLDLVSLAEVLGAHGLRTGFFNSSDNRFQNTEGFARTAGFDHVVDYRDWTCKTGVYEHASVTDQFLNTSSDLCTADQIVRWIEDRPDTPFFAAFRTGMTHYPYFPGEDPQTFSGDQVYNDYLNALHVGDAAFGRLMAYLETSGRAEETLVIVLGDHGEAFGEHGTHVHAAGIHEENVHIPLAIINPQLFSGQRSDVIVGVSDLAPTITDLMGLPTPAAWQGRSAFAAQRPDGVLVFSPWNGFLVGYRAGNTKYIYNGNSGEQQLYDLATDPEERRNLAQADPQQAREARDTLGAALSAHSQFIDWLLDTHGARPLEAAAADEVVIEASGTRYASAPQGWVMIDGLDVGGFSVSSAPSNAARRVSDQEILAGMQTFRLPASVGACPREMEIFFINDEWAGDDQTGDTDLVIRSVSFAGSTYHFNRFVPLHEGAGGPYWETFRFWREGGVRIALDLDKSCLPATLVQQ